MSAQGVKEAEGTAIVHDRRRTTWKHWVAYLIAIAIMAYFNRDREVAGGAIGTVIAGVIVLLILGGIWYLVCRIRKRPFSWAGALITLTIFYGVVDALAIIDALIPDPANYLPK
jgi:hypothetical protein